MASANQKTMTKKIEFILLGVVCLAIVVFLLMLGAQKYTTWKFNHDLAVLQAEEERPYQEDTYGGKTPKETLELFIAAVEKGDYDLASKYFILTKQEEWRTGLVKIEEKNNLNFVLTKLKKIVAEIDSGDPTKSLGGQKFYTVGSEVPVTFIKYPNGNWKIEEI